MDATLHDLRLAIRSLTRKPGSTLIAVLTLALGIGASAAIYSVVHGVLLRPLGFTDEDRLVTVLTVNRSESNKEAGTALPDFWFWEKHQRSFSEMGFFAWQTLTLEEPGRVEQLSGVYVSPNLFDLLGIDPAHGRLFNAADVDAGRGRAILASWELWQRAWDGDVDAVGRTVRIDGEALTLVGVLPPETHLPGPGAKLWMPVGETDERYGRFSREERDFIAVGRLAPGVRPAAAQAEMDALGERLAEEFPATNGDLATAVAPLRDHLVGSAKRPIWIAFGAVGLVLLLACANIAHLLLVRASGREREMAVRAALGAGRGRLIRQLLTESLVLASAGGALGALLAAWLCDALLALAPGILPRTHAITLNLPVLLFAASLALATGLLCGLAPALHGASAFSAALRAGGHRTLGAERGLGRPLLLASEIALALTLLAGAALLLDTLRELGRVDPGFEAGGVYHAHILLDANRYGEREARAAYFERLRQRVSELPGVEAAGLTTATPVPGLGIQIDLPYRRAEDLPFIDGGAAAPRAALRVSSPGYLETVGIPLLNGRDLSIHDNDDGTPVVLVNQVMAERLWPAEDAVGRRIELAWGDERIEAEVMGVVGATRFAGLHRAPRAEVYIPHAQVPFFGTAIVARTSLSEAAYTEALRGAVLEIDPLQPFNQVRSLERELAGEVATERFFAALLSIFAGIALILAAAGIYGVFSFWVSRRTGEIGVRMALGASAGQTLREVVGRGLAITGVGLLAGLAGAWGVAALLRGAFAGVASASPWVLGVVMLLLGTVAALACLVPAHRASRVAPSVALRCD